MHNLSPHRVASLAESLHPLERKVLPLFAKEGRPLSELQLLEADRTLQPAQLSMALEWLQAKEILTVCEERREEWVSLTEGGRRYAAPHKNPFLHIVDEVNQRLASSFPLPGEGDSRQISSVPLDEIGRALEPEERSSAIGALKKGGALLLTSGAATGIDSVSLNPFLNLQRLIDNLAQSQEAAPFHSLDVKDKEIIQSYQRKRGKHKGIFRLDDRVCRTFLPKEIFWPVYEKMVQRGGAHEVGVLTPEMLREGSWRGKTFRKYNLDLSPPRACFGGRHPYAIFLDEVREKLVAMGFVEMEGPIVESEFWNMDALYMPQFHPARAIHDVYYVKGPLYDETLPEEFIDRVAAAHERGCNASSGWGYPFDRRRTRRLVLRSQGTAISARRLASFPTVAGRYFSIARCFRYDRVDATHAPDFFQIEGIVLGEEVHFRGLLGLLTLFAKEMAKAKELRFLPTYFPFTEPSVEVKIAHPDLGFIELGGAGLFRPEVTGPLGVNLPVMAWGLGLDRLAMVALKIVDIRDLFSPDLSWIRGRRESVGPL